MLPFYAVAAITICFVMIVLCLFRLSRLVLDTSAEKETYASSPVSPRQAIKYYGTRHGGFTVNRKDKNPPVPKSFWDSIAVRGTEFELTLRSASSPAVVYKLRVVDIVDLVGGKSDKPDIGGYEWDYAWLNFDHIDPIITDSAFALPANQTADINIITVSTTSDTASSSSPRTQDSGSSPSGGGGTVDRTSSTWTRKPNAFNNVSWSYGTARLVTTSGAISWAEQPASSSPLLDGNYVGLYGAKFDDVFKTETPGVNFAKYTEAVKEAVKAQSSSNYKNADFRGTGFGENNPHDPKAWHPLRWGVNPDGHYQLQDGFGSTGSMTVGSAQLKLYGGPGLWCDKGQGNHIPATVPLPFSPAAAAASSNQQTVFTGHQPTAPSLAERISQVKVNVPYKIVHSGRVHGDNCAGFVGTHQYDSDQLPLAVQPNGGLQVAMRVDLDPKIGKRGGFDQSGWSPRKAIYVAYVNPTTLQLVGSFLVEGVHLGGIAAIGDTGTALLFTQKQCEAVSISKSFQDLNKAVVACWDKGKLLWARQLTDVYKQSTNEFSNKNGDGDYVESDFQFWSQLRYDGEANQVRALFPQTGGRGGHQGCSYYALDAKTGDVIFETPTCSHCWGSRLLPKASAVRQYSVLCLDDATGVKRVADSKSHDYSNVLYVTRGGNAGGDDEFKNCESWYGNTARLLNVVQASRTKYFAVVTTRRCTKQAPPNGDETFPPTEKNKLRILELDENTLLKKVHTVTIPDPTGKAEPFHCHLVPYSSPNGGKQTFLLYYVSFDCCDAEKEVYIWGPKVGQTQCPPKYMAVTMEYDDNNVNGGEFKLGSPVETGVKMLTQNDPVVVNSGGGQGLVWAFYAKDSPNANDDSAPWNVVFTFMGGTAL